MDEEPKQRHIKIDFMLLAYLGDFLKNMEQAVQEQTREAMKSLSSSNRMHQERNPDDQ
jgi:hypothetical protein